MAKIIKNKIAKSPPRKSNISLVAEIKRASKKALNMLNKKEVKKSAVLDRPPEEIVGDKVLAFLFFLESKR